MKLTVVKTGSAANCYLLQASDSSLIIECGVRPEFIMKKYPKFSWDNISGVLVTHEHGDHAAFAEKFLNLGIELYASRGTLEALGLDNHLRTNVLTPLHTLHIGQFIIKPFLTKHDASEPLGFIIEHEEMGKLLFITDSRPARYTFLKECVQHILVEANYDDAILDEMVIDGKIPLSQCQRIRATHMEISDAIQVVKDNITSFLVNVVFIHTSSRHGDKTDFRKRLVDIYPFLNVYVAEPGLTIDIDNDLPF